MQGTDTDATSILNTPYGTRYRLLTKTSFSAALLFARYYVITSQLSEKRN